MKLLSTYFRNFRSINHRIFKLLAKKNRRVELDVLEAHLKNNAGLMYAELQIRSRHIIFLSINGIKFPVLSDNKVVRVYIPILTKAKLKIIGIGFFNRKNREFVPDPSGKLISPKFSGNLIRELSSSSTSPQFVHSAERYIHEERTKPKETILYQNNLAINTSNLSFQPDYNLNINLNLDSVLNELKNTTAHEK